MLYLKIRKLAKLNWQARATKKFSHHSKHLQNHKNIHINVNPARPRPAPKTWHRLPNETMACSKKKQGGICVSGDRRTELRRLAWQGLEAETDDNKDAVNKEFKDVDSSEKETDGKETQEVNANANSVNTGIECDSPGDVAFTAKNSADDGNANVDVASDGVVVESTTTHDNARNTVVDPINNGGTAADVVVNAIVNDNINQEEDRPVDALIKVTVHMHTCYLTITFRHIWQQIIQNLKNLMHML